MKENLENNLNITISHINDGGPNGFVPAIRRVRNLPAHLCLLYDIVYLLWRQDFQQFFFAEASDGHLLSGYDLVGQIPLLFLKL